MKFSRRVKLNCARDWDDFDREIKYHDPTDSLTVAAVADARIQDLTQEIRQQATAELSKVGLRHLK